MFFFRAHFCAIHASILFMKIFKNLKCAQNVVFSTLFLKIKNVYKMWYFGAIHDPILCMKIFAN